MKYLHKITQSQLNSILPWNPDSFCLLHFEKLSDNSYLLHYEGHRQLITSKQTDIEIVESEEEKENGHKAN